MKLALLLLSSIAFAQQVPPSISFPINQGIGQTYTVGATPVSAYRVTSYVAGAITVAPHVGTGNSLGISKNSGSAGALIWVTSYGSAICEFDGSPVVYHVATANGDKCHDSGATALSAISTGIGAFGRTLIVRPDLCTNCAEVLVIGPALVGRQIQMSDLPSGLVTFVTSGTCSSGWTEISGLNGFTVIGTIAANGDVGTSGGSNTITPAGTVSTPTFTGNSVTSSAVSAGTPAGTNSAPALTMNSYTPAGSVAAPTFTGGAGTVPAQTFTGSSGTIPAETITWPVGVPAFTGGAGTVPAQTFTGNSITSSAVSGGTPAGTNGASATSGNCATTNIAAGTGSATACKAASPNLTVTAQTFTGSALGTHTHTTTATGTNGTAAFTPAGTVAWPAGVPTNSTVSFTPAGTNGTASFTPAGTNSAPTFTGNASTLTGSVATPVFTGSALGTHTHTDTATGSVSQPTFTGTQFDNRPAFLRVIFCQKN